MSVAVEAEFDKTSYGRRSGSGSRALWATHLGAVVAGLESHRSTARFAGDALHTAYWLASASGPAVVPGVCG